jgi:NCAIR mutase (PurE)-related protein
MPERTREIVELLAAGVGGAAVSGFWGWVTRRTSNPAENRTGEAAVLMAATKLQEVMNEAVERASDRLNAEMDDLRLDNIKLRERIEKLEGDNRNLVQIRESLQAILVRAGIDWEQATQPGAVLVVEGGTATVTPPRRRGRKS